MSDNRLPADMMYAVSKMIVWTDEELLLALEVMHRRDWRGGNARDPEFVELSRLLNRTNFPGAQNVGDNFRSPSAVSYKTGNLIGANPNAAGGFKFTSREKELVAEYLADPAAVLARAREVRSRIVH